MSYRHERLQPRRRRRLGCLSCLVAIVWIVLLGGLAYNFLLRRQVSEYIGQLMGQQLRSSIAEQADAPPAQQSPEQQQLQQGAQEILPTAVAALPSGELRLTEAEANNYLLTYADRLKPIDAATIRFVPGEIQISLQALRTTSTARMSLAAQNGRLIAVDPQIDGILGRLIALDDLVQPLVRQFNDQMALQNRRVTDVRIEQGELIVTIQGET